VPPLTALSNALESAEAYGQAVCDLSLLLPLEQVVPGARRAVPLTHATGEVTIPAVAEEISAVTAAWRRELEREVGIASFEGDRAPH
jgi:hypothetical protein